MSSGLKRASWPGGGFRKALCRLEIYLVVAPVNRASFTHPTTGHDIVSSIDPHHQFATRRCALEHGMRDTLPARRVSRLERRS